MTVQTNLTLRGVDIDAAEEARILHQLDALGQRLTHEPEPLAELVLSQSTAQRRVEADLRVLLNRLGTHLVSHQSADTAERAVRLAVADVERQLERRHSQQSGEPTFGVPSRRLPRSLRLHPFSRREPQEGEDGEEEGETGPAPSS
jgi:hypothetical protein